MATWWLHCPTPRLAQHNTERSSLNLWFLWGKRRLRVGIQLSQHYRSFFSGVSTLVHPTGIAGGSMGWPLGIWMWQRGREGLATISTQILADCFPSCNAQVMVLTSVSIICRMKLVTQSNQRMWWCTGLPDSGIQTKSSWQVAGA